ncbi:hypothetical protein [Chryseobacterium indoltheticum]|uniref:Uncharacterized protein n=1 Tax=Chryseobacterium indoltheticum TaxID=254 RepID=A0A1N7AP85_9FLAO|nr:hypothetical protein [Chryseobacterium indoltheticum]AZA75190.1 hypothetical protein EG358_16085 [Chryseobacterium indoltheticum]SIR14084.1 hypothetical protein SAMN05421682_11337 [Chryseobacterium indoltheticum]SIR40919.1 hypothetical protein SAMN05421682_1262 [Chryseobacterium indoltheticum]SUX41676.1 Uncharacterised protein [Chryseobacterium indoltheticum]
MKKFLIIFLIVKLFISCSKKEKNINDLQTSLINKNDSITKEENPYIANYDDKKRKKKLLDSAIIYGDTLSYQEAFKDFLIAERSQEFLYYSIKMGKIHNYGEAYFDTYYIMNLLDNRNKYISEKDKKVSLYYLLKAYEMNNSTAKDKLNDLYLKKNKKIPTSASILGE